VTQNSDSGKRAGKLKTDRSESNFDKKDMDSLWEKSLELLEAHPDITEASFKSLFLRMAPIGYEDDIFVLGVPNSFFKRRVEKTCLIPIVETLRTLGENENLVVLIEEDDSVLSNYEVAPVPPELLSPPNIPDPNPSEIISRSLSGANGGGLKKNETPTFSTKLKEDPSKNFNDVKLDPKFNFDSYVVGASNTFAYTSALAVAESPGLSYNPLFIWGTSGLGKTHLLHAIGNHIMEMYPEKKIVCTTASNFLNQYVERTANPTKRPSSGKRKITGIEEMRNHYRKIDLLLIDDIQDLKGVGTTELFFNTFNYLKERHKQIVLVADRSPEELNLDERMTSRFKSGLMVDVQPPTYEMRCAILKNLAARYDISFTDEAIDYVAEKSSDNIRELEGAVIRINAWANMQKESTATLDLVKKAIPNFFPEKEDMPISISDIKKVVCRTYNVSHVELEGSKRKQEIVYPRHIAMFLCAELTDSSTPQIGKSFGKRDHTTVMHAVDKIRKKMAAETETYDQIQYLTKILRTRKM